MKKLTSIFFILGSLCHFSATAQKTLNFKATDGTTAEVTLVSTNPDEGRNSSLYAGFFGPEGINNIGFSNYGPGKYYINIMGGATGGMIDGSYFFITKVKESTVSNSLKDGNNVAYVGKLPLEKRTAFGLHGGAGYTDYSLFNTASNNSYSTMSGFGGISLLKAKHIEIFIDETSRRGARNGTLIMRLNADAIFYFGQKFVQGKAVNPGGATDLASMTRTMGFRLYLDGKATLWGRKGRLSINYMVGVGRNSDASTKLPAIGGLGLGYNF